MQVVIFCGGQGTRLREETEHRPKPMVPVGGRPILWHIMKTYASFGHTEFILCLGYKGEMIKEYFLNYRAMNSDFTMRLGHHSECLFHDPSDEADISVTLCDTGLQTTTTERLLKIRRHLRDEPFLVTYGDGLSDVDIDALAAFHRSHGRVATVTAVHTLSRFGVLDLDAKGKVLSFAEKPETDGRINAGYFVFNQEIFPTLERFARTPLEQDALRSLADASQLMAYTHDGFFYAMDTYREYLHLNELWDRKEAPWARWLHEERRTLTLRKTKGQALKKTGKARIRASR